MKKYNLPTPESVFTLSYFKEQPDAFYRLAKEIYPTNFKPTITHQFIKLLNDKGILLRCFTQNIDGLERIAGLPEDKLIEAHGSFKTAHCVSCKLEHSGEYFKKCVFADIKPLCTNCNGYVKPDIVFFGEDLPKKFREYVRLDLPKADLLIVMGTCKYILS